MCKGNGQEEENGLCLSFFSFPWSLALCYQSPACHSNLHSPLCEKRSARRGGCSVDSNLKKKTDRQNNQCSLCLLSLAPFPIVFSFDLGSAHQKEPSPTDAKLSQETFGFFWNDDDSNILNLHCTLCEF